MFLLSRMLQNIIVKLFLIIKLSQFKKKPKLVAPQSRAKLRFQISYGIEYIKLPALFFSILSVYLISSNML